MDIKYNVSKIKSSKEEVIKDSVSVEEPLEMRLKYKKEGKSETQNISITMRTPGNDEDLIRGFLFNERIIENMNEIDNNTSLSKFPTYRNFLWFNNSVNKTLEWDLILPQTTTK